jgi:hypothetical protein
VAVADDADDRRRLGRLAVGADHLLVAVESPISRMWYPSRAYFFASV